MKIKFHYILAFFIVTLFLDFDYTIANFKIRPLDIFLAVVFCFILFSQKHLRIINHFVCVSFYVFILFIILNSFAKVPFVTLVKESIQIIEYLFLMHLIANVTVDPLIRKQFLNVIFWGTGAVAIFCVAYHVSRGIYSGFKDLDSPKHSFAYFALFAIINYFSHNKRKGFYLFVVLLALFMALLSGERKGWAGLLVGGSYFVFLQLRSSDSKKNIKAIVRFATVVIIIGIVSSLLLLGNTRFHYFDKQISSVSTVLDRLTSSDNISDTKSDDERIYMFNYGIMLFHKNPIFGIGIEQFPVSISHATRGLYRHDAHNFYLKILDEEGLVGLALLIIFNVTLFWFLLKRTRNKIPHIAFAARCMVALFLLGAVVNCFLASKALTWMYFLIPCGVFIGITKEAGLRKRMAFAFNAENDEAVSTLVTG